jgi:hypothetical protein
MHRRQPQSRSYGTTLAIVALFCAAAYQLFTKGLPEQFSAEPIQIAPTHDTAAAGEALALFRAGE